MLKKALVLILLGLALCGAALAAPQQLPPYPTGYWVYGTLAKGGASNAAGYKVVVYTKSGEPAEGFSYGVSDANGKFFINVMDDLRLLPMTPSTPYYIGVVAKLDTTTNKYFGVNQADLGQITPYLNELDLRNNSKQIDLALVEGQGITDPVELTITTPSLPSGVINKPYLQENGQGVFLTATGGQTPYTWTIVAGRLPTGLSLITDQGKISGTPTVGETQTFTVQVTDSGNPAKSSLKSFTLTILTEPPYVLKDNGWIRNSNIARVGNSLLLTWDYAPYNTSDGVMIYYTDNDITNNYTNGPENLPSESSYIDSPIVLNKPVKEYTITNIANKYFATDNKSHFFRIVPYPLATGTTSFLDDINNSITLGKTATIIETADKYRFASLPFMEDQFQLSKLVGDQLGDGGEFLWWGGTSYGGATYAGGKWIGNDKPLRLGEGFILRAKAAKTLALVGRIGTILSETGKDPERACKAGEYKLIGYPWPAARYFQYLSIIAIDGDDLLSWSFAPQAFEGATFSGGNWRGAAGIDQLSLGDPRFYRPKQDNVWRISVPWEPKLE